MLLLVGALGRRFAGGPEIEIQRAIRAGDRQGHARLRPAPLQGQVTDAHQQDRTAETVTAIGAHVIVHRRIIIDSERS